MVLKMIPASSELCILLWVLKIVPVITGYISEEGVKNHTHILGDVPSTWVLKMTPAHSCRLMCAGTKNRTSTSELAISIVGVKNDTHILGVVPSTMGVKNRTSVWVAFSSCGC